MVDGGKSGPVGALYATRQHVLKIVGGLDDTALRRSVLPSGWNWLEMIKHLTCDEELFWIPRGGRRASMKRSTSLQTPSARASWRVADTVPAAYMLAGYRTQIEQSNTIIAATELTAPGIRHIRRRP